MKKVLIIADPLQNLNIHGDSSYLLMLTAHDAGIELYYANPHQLYALNNQAYALTSRLQLHHGLADIYSQKHWFTLTQPAVASELSQFTAILVRNDPPFNLEYYYLTQILELAERAGVKVINPPRQLRSFNEKLAILNFPELITPTLVAKDKAVIKDFIATHGNCVAKPIDMMAGRGVFKISPSDPNHDAILENLTDYYQQTIMVQRFIPEVTAGDKRIFIINGEVVSHCLYRIPQAGQIRGNLAVGGRGEVHPLADAEYHLATTVAKWLQEQGILIAGLDVIGNYLTEINITSPTGMQQIYQQAGVNVAQLIINLIL